jgi:hypothetical protein
MWEYRFRHFPRGCLSKRGPASSIQKREAGVRSPRFETGNFIYPILQSCLYDSAPKSPASSHAEPSTVAADPSSFQIVFAVLWSSSCRPVAAGPSPAISNSILWRDDSSVCRRDDAVFASSPAPHLPFVSFVAFHPSSYTLSPHRCERVIVCDRS